MTEGLVIVYLPRVTGDPDEGRELLVTCKKVLVKQMIEDPEIKEYFEFRGLEVGVLEY